MVLTPLWIYSIHSNNPEIIHFLEEYHDKPPNDNSRDSFFESIKFHYNDIEDNIRNKLLATEHDQDRETQKQEMCQIVDSSNFTFWPDEIDNKFFFFYICSHGYSKSFYKIK